MPELPTCYTVDVTEPAPYLLEHVDRELERLLALAEREAEQVRLACRQVGLAQGGSAIDVGCGPLGALRTLAEVVGERGRVVGLDASADAIGRAREVCRALGLGRVELVCADALRCDFAQLRLWRAFDLAYCRCVCCTNAIRVSCSRAWARSFGRAASSPIKISWTSRAFLAVSPTGGPSPRRRRARCSGASA